MKIFSIGELSNASGVKVPTIRYHEQIELIAAPERSAGGQRRYVQADLERLSFVRHARDLGLSIEAIRDLIELSAQPDLPCADADRIAQTHLGDVREKIAGLRKLERELERITTHCTGNQVKDCYVIRALADHTLCESTHQ
jgi:DNA-binding transcriptional MerR regulator